MSTPTTHHNKTDSSEGTSSSLAASSPNRPVYFVQSPSRDSHDGEKTTNSFHSTPIISPSGSPGRHSRGSSSTRFSGSLGKSATGSQKSATRPPRDGRRKSDSRRRRWKEFDAIEEEGLLGQNPGSTTLPRRCYFLAFVVGFFVLFGFFSLILWGASRNQKPDITIKSISFNQFGINAGMDNSGVATEMVSMNSTVKFLFHNAGTFFGVHVTSTPLVLSFSEITLAIGDMKKFYQSRKSARTVTVTVTLRGSGIPLYGGGASLSSKDGKPTAPVPLTLNFMVWARAYVLGKLVRPRFRKTVSCYVVMDPERMNVAISLKKSCTYT